MEEILMPTKLHTHINPKVDYLRISITDQCNLQCMYCVSSCEKELISREHILNYNEIARLVNIFAHAGIRKVRITGGEPLIKKDIVELITMLRDIELLQEITLTTNGINLEKLVVPLKYAGIDRINISLDSLKKSRFKNITGVDSLDDVIRGIDKALCAGFNPIKLNVIPMLNVNDDEIIDFVNYAIENSLIVRFIELFSTNESSRKHINLRMTHKEVIRIIQNHFGPLKPTQHIYGNGPAEYFSLVDNIGVIGFISNYSKNFCSSCTRIRVDCSGKISPCLFSGPKYDAKILLRNKSSDEKLFKDIKEILYKKYIHTKNTHKDNLVEMSSVGG